MTTVIDRIIQMLMTTKQTVVVMFTIAHVSFHLYWISGTASRPRWFRIFHSATVPLRLEVSAVLIPI